MKRIYYTITLLVCLSLSCGMSAQLPTQTATPRVKAESPMVQPKATDEARQMMTVYHSGGLRLRECAGQSCKEVEILPDGEIVTLTGKSETVTLIPWYEVVTEDGRTGWVLSKYLRGE